MPDIVITAATRTPIGSFGGAFANVSAVDLGTTVITAALDRSGVKPDEVSEVIFGQVLTAGTGQNPARQSAIKAGIPAERTAVTINQVCGSGLRTMAMAYQALAAGDADVVVAGGQENMSLSTHCAHLRDGKKMGSMEMVDTMIVDGLWDAFNGYHMGTTAENVAEKWQITREAQDAFAAKSQQKAVAAVQSGRFADEITPVTVKTRKGETVVDTDEYPRDGTTAESLAKLRAAFAKDGTVTAGNASGLNDGAAAVVMMRADEAERRGPDAARARRRPGRRSGSIPPIMGSGPIPASRAALDKAGWTPEELDLVEANEAFAAQACAVNKDLGWDAREGQRQRRRHRARPPHRRLGHPRHGHAAARDGQDATQRRVSPRCASAAAWASPCASSASAEASPESGRSPHRNRAAAGLSSRLTGSEALRIAGPGARPRAGGTPVPGRI